MSKVRSSSEQENCDEALRYKKDSRRTKEITNSLIEMIAKDVYPFSILKDTGFVNFVKVLNDRYELPNENTLTSKYLPELYKIKCAKIMQKLSKVETVHFTIDSWTDINRDLYFLAVTAHFCIDGTLQRNTLQVSHFSTRDEVKRIQKTVARAMDEWKIDLKVKTVVSNCKVAIKKQPWKHIMCFGHTLYLAVENAIKEANITTIDAMFRKCRKIVKLLQTSDSLRKQQIGEGFPKISCLERRTVGRWSSTYSMLSRMIELRGDWSSIFSNSKDVPVLNENDWNMISGATNVLEPLYLAISEMSKNHYVTISDVMPIVFCIEDKLKNLENLQSDVELFRKNLLNKLDELYKMIESDLVYAVATFLNPRYKGTLFRSEDSVKLIKDQLTKAYDNTRYENKSEKKMKTAENAETVDFWEALHKKNQERGVNTEYSSPSFTAELDKYLNSEAINSNPITWWNTNGNKMFPDLVKPALEYLCIPALAVPSEHLFANMRQIILDRRTRLQLKYVNMLAVLGWN